MLAAADAFPMNLGFLGKGNASLPEPLREQMRAGAIGLKLHEDWGTTPAAIDSCLDRRRRDRRAGRDPHRHAERVGLRRGHASRRSRAARSTPIHTEGAGGGHAPDIIKVCGEPNVLPSSTNPTRPYTVNTHRRAPRHADGVPPPRPGDRRGRRVRRVAHPPRDDRRRGHPARPRRVLDDVVRLAGDGPRRRGDHPHLADRAQDEGAARRAAQGDPKTHDNARVKRYVAKYTINPAITHGIAHEVGSIEVGKLADLVLWKPAFFGVKPSLILKGGMIAAAAMGDPNASIPTPQPVHYRPMFGAFGGGAAAPR